MEGLEVSGKFWKGKSVFLTGHTGFKGSWLSLWLLKQGAKVTGYSLAPNTKPALFQTLKLSDDLESVIADVRDLEKLRKSFTGAKPDVVFHLAAQPLVRRSYQAPLETYSTNVMGTANLLEAVRLASASKSSRACTVVVATTDKVYENREWAWGYRESEALGGYDPYSSSKAAAELVVAAYRRSFFNPEKKSEHGVSLASARAGNVIGGGDWSEDRLVPDMVRAFQAGKPLRMRNPTSTRPWQHVLEPLSGYMSLAEQMRLADSTAPTKARVMPAKVFDAFNFGPHDDDCRPVGEFVQAFAKFWGDDARLEIDKGPHAHEAGFLKLDSSKAKQVLGWRPHWDLETALEKTVEWYKAVGAKAPLKQARDCSLGQIAEWESK